MFPEPRTKGEFIKRSKAQGWTLELCPDCNPKSKVDIDGNLKGQPRPQQNTRIVNDDSSFDVLKHLMEK